MSTRVAAAWSPLVSPPFLICLVLLGAVAFLSGPMAQRWKLMFIKLPVECRKPLHEMRRDAFGPYKLWQDPIQLSATIENALGTDKYISWWLKDTRREDTDPRCLVHLHVAYYTGGPNLAPHTPDTCMRGAGYEIDQAANSTISIPSLAPDETEIPVRVVTFVKSAVHGRAKPTVVYTFHCNGQFACGRTDVRVLTTNPVDRYAYFSKVELNFSDATLETNPTREEAVDAARDFMEYLLPVLLHEHWPDWQELQTDEDSENKEPDRTTPA